MKRNKILPSEKPPGASPQHQPNPRKRILVVEDEPDFRRLNIETLASSGYHVDGAEDGADAWDTLQLNQYDLIITDNNMPKVSGMELLQKLHEARLKLPVIMVTGIVPQAELERHPWLDIKAVKAVMFKPYTFDELLNTVKKVLHAATDHSKENAPAPNWQSQPLFNGLRL
jgi:DNA-binding response OmpR family regulator